MISGKRPGQGRLLFGQEVNSMKKNKGLGALLPVGVFLALYLGFGVLFEYVLGTPGGFYDVSAVVVFLVALLIAVLQDRTHSFEEKIGIMARGVSDSNIILMCLVFLTAGAFSGAVEAAGGAESTVALFLSVLPDKIAVGGLFLIACFISLSMGSSCATIAALASFAVAISEATGFSLALCHHPRRRLYRHPVHRQRRRYPDSGWRSYDRRRQ